MPGVIIVHTAVPPKWYFSETLVWYVLIEKTAEKIWKDMKEREETKWCDQTFKLLLQKNQTDLREY